MEKMSLPYEVWRAVVGYEGYYEVSNWGRVRSLHYGKERILIPVDRGNGYLVVSLSKDGKTKLCYVHRLVAEAFIPNPDNLPCVNHKNKQKDFNFVENLEWITLEDNFNYGTARARTAKANTNGKKSKVVYQKTLNGEFVREWPSLSEIKRQTSWKQSAISSCCLGKCKSAYGFLWGYTKKAENF